MLKLSMNGNAREAAAPKTGGNTILDRLGMAEFQRY